jgi:hypothetical protein
MMALLKHYLQQFIPGIGDEDFINFRIEEYDVSTIKELLEFVFCHSNPIVSFSDSLSAVSHVHFSSSVCIGRANGGHNPPAPGLQLTPAIQ